MKRKKFVGIAILICAFLVFFVRSTIFLDPDFGWHLKMGEIISSSGIPATDPFSYTMPSFPFIDHEWLTNIAVYRIYNTFGYLGLAAISTLLVIISVAYLVGTKKGKPQDAKRVSLNDLLYMKIGKTFLGPNFLLPLSLAVLLPYFGIRAQVQSWLLLALLTTILFSETLWAKCKYAVPIIILFWANLHGSFVVGVGVLTAFIFIRTLGRRADKTDLLILLLSFLATLINPYGARLWHEVWVQASDGTLRWNITEWMPSLFMLDISYVSLLAFSTFLMFRYRKKFLPEELFIYFAFLVEALFSRRNVPLWVVISFPLTTRTIYFFYDEIRQIKGAIGKFQKLFGYTWFIALFLLIVASVVELGSAEDVSEGKFYPKEAVLYLAENLPDGEIFSEYGWGGYLIWKLPEKKVFIDGRMPSWRWSDSPTSESSAAFDDYIAVVDGKRDYKETFRKYNINTVLWPKAARGELLDVLAQKISHLFNKDEDERFSLSVQLEKDGWYKVYEDSSSVIYESVD